MNRFVAHFGAKPHVRAEAPGRVNLIGEHTDYNGGLVLPVAIGLRTAVELRYRDDARVRAVSREGGAAEAGLSDPARGSWLDYLRGVAQALAGAGRIPPRGFDVAVQSEVPVGAGLASSAALEVAVALALAQAAGAPYRTPERAELASLCQRAEGEFVGVPCGIMDPYVALLGRAGHALLLRSQTLEAHDLPLPDDLEILILDTGIRHRLREGGYATRREECARALARARGPLGRSLDSLSDIEATDLPVLEGRLAPPLFARLRHVVTENQRVLALAEAFRQGDRRGAGEALYASHESLRLDYEVTWAEGDALVELSRGVPGVIGARMTGAGWGGCTLHLVERAEARATGERLQALFEARFGHRPRLWRTRPGAGASVGVL